MTETTGEEQAIGHGYVFGETFDVQPVVYAVRDGLAVFEGDIVLGTVEEMAARTAFVEGPLAARLADRAFPALAIPGGRTRWPDGVIPYEIDPALPPDQRAAVEAAVEHWNTVTRLHLTPRSGEADYVQFVPGSGCSSHVGRQGGRQELWLGTGCFFGQATHELGHAAGLWHEQSREDRDSFVTIVWDNVDEAQRHNFDQHITDGDDVGPYDYGSIMHYPATAFSINGEPTIVPVRPGVSIGQREALSPGDRAGIRAIYLELEPSDANTWVGAFSGGARDEVLYYLRSRRTWHLGSWESGALRWSVVGSSAPAQVRVVGSGLLAYADGKWSLGSLTSGRLEWSAVEGPPANDLTWTGRFGDAGILTCSRADGNWWLGSVRDATLSWSFAGNTQGFTADVSRLHVGDFDGDGRDELLVEDAGEWWLAALVDDQFEWRVVGNTVGALRAAPVAATVPESDESRALHARVSAAQDALRAAADDDRSGLVREMLTLRASLRRATRAAAPVAAVRQASWPNFGALDDGRPFWVGRFREHEGLLFYSPADANWWLGSFASGSLEWSFAGNTLQFGAVNDGRPVHVVDLDGDGHDEVAFRSPADGTWWVGSFASGSLTWAAVGTTPPLPGPLWAGSFTGDAGQLLSYDSADATCRVGALEGTALTWDVAGTFEA